MEIEIKNTDHEPIKETFDWRPELRLCLDEDGKAWMYVHEVHSSNNGVPMDVWHGRTRRWTKKTGSGVVSLAALKELAEKLSPLLDRVHAGHSVEWDGNNMVGKLTEDAREAEQEIESILEDATWHDDAWSVWAASEWVSDFWRETAKDIGLTANATAEQMAEAETKLEAMAKRDKVMLTDVSSAVKWLVEKLAEEAEAA